MKTYKREKLFTFKKQEGKMKIKQKNIFLMMFLIGALVVMAPQWATAACVTGVNCTASGTAIINTASMAYTVNATGYTLESSPLGNSTVGAGQGTDTTFDVDDKVNLVVTGDTAADETVFAGESYASHLQFTVTNTGNNIHDFAMTAVLTAETFTPTSATFYSDAARTILLPNVAGVQYISQLAADTDSIVYLSIVVPAAANIGEVASYIVTAEAYQGNAALVTSSSAQSIIDAAINKNASQVNLDTVYVVAADIAGPGGDALYDGKYSRTSPFQFIVGTGLTITKTMAVSWDPINLFISPKAIPGAVITYLVSVANAAGAPTASAITITDTLDANTTVQAIFTGCAAGEAVEIDTLCAANVPAGNTLTVVVPNIAGGITRTIEYEAVIK